MEKMDRLNALACQIAIPRTETAADRDAHLAASAARISSAINGRPCDIVILPELASIAYSRAAFERLDVLAEPLNGPSFHCWRQVARKHRVHVVYGFARRSADGHHISVGVVAPSGELVTWYDKIHLAQYGASMEKEFFRPGQGYAVFEAGGFRISPMICRDIRSPEPWRRLTVTHGAEVLLHPTAFFRDQSFHSWHAFATVRALENQCYFLSVNRAGADFGASILCPPWIDETVAPVVLDASAEDLRMIEISRAEIRTARDTYGFLADRLESYDLPLHRPVEGEA